MQDIFNWQDFNKLSLQNRFWLQFVFDNVY